MTSQRILLPLDIRKWPVEVFSVVNNLAKDPGVAVTLLHVVMLNLSAPEKRVYEAVGRDAQWHLGHLARGCLRPGVTAHTRVRFGKPAEEILAEAVAGNTDLIVLAAKPPSFWRRFFAPLVPRVVERVIREATCGVFLTTAKKLFNCESIWPPPRERHRRGIGASGRSCGKRTLPRAANRRRVRLGTGTASRRCLTAATEPPLKGCFRYVAALRASSA
jgi:nucleotide-binding universal stress UspA family protein